MICNARTFVILLIVIASALVFTACGGGSPAPTATAVPTVAPPTDTPAPTPTEAPTTAPTAAPTEEETAATEAPTEAVTEEAEAATAAPAEAATEEAEAATEAPTEAATEEATEVTAPVVVASDAEELAPTPAEAAPAGVVSVASARRVADVLNERDAPFAAISPDGSRIAWFTQSGRRRDRTGELCLFTFANADKTCYPIATERFRDWPYQLQWSPDSSMITFTENPIQLGNDADIWLFTVADGSFQNLTDDGVTGSWRSAADALIDYLPAWNPADGSIVFWRVKPLDFPNFAIGLYKITPGGEAELVRDLTDALPQQLPLFQQEAFFMDGFSAVSPDGTKLAAIVSTLGQFGGLQPNLWVIDLADAAAEPVQVMSFADYQAAIPTWPGIPATPVGLSWTADSAGVASIAVSNMGNSTPFTVFFYSDLAAGTSALVVDFSSVEDSSMYFSTAPGSDLPWRAYSPWTGALSPSGTKLLMLNDLTGRMGLFTSPLPPTGELPGLAIAANQSISSQGTRSSRASNGLMLLYGLLLTVVEE
ncbi:MAG TPA: hypothetical protein GYA08_20435 [Chloroflexi bacterium]|nr:hypothetical protein [Chloroflexota bacterium]